MMKKRTPRDYKFVRLIGEGSFSSVYLAVDACLRPPSLATGDQQDRRGDDERGLPTPKVRKYAIKVCQKSHIKRQGKQVAIMREKEIMNILNQYPSDRFIRLYCTFQDFERLFFVMSYAEHGELLTYMLQHPLSLDQVRRFTLQLVEALEFLHKLGIVHRDLKPENILLGERFNILISDFGSAQIYGRPTNTIASSPMMSPALSASSVASSLSATTALDSTLSTQDGISNHAQSSSNCDTTSCSPATTVTGGTTVKSTTPGSATNDRRNSFVGTAQYVSPEMLKNREASNKSDLWALGAIIFQMISNVMPFDAPNEYLIYRKIQSLDYTFPQDFDPSARDLVSQLIRLAPQERLGARDNLQEEGYTSIRGHSFLENFDESRVCFGEVRKETSHLHDSDLANIDKIAPGLDETQLLRLLTDA